MNDRVILGCSSLELYIAAAQDAAGTDHPVVLMDRVYHSEPADMRAHLLAALDDLPEGVTVLAAMGFCGGSWDGVITPRTLVLPHVDDCITLLMHTPARRGVDLKEPGHFYLVNDTQRELSPEIIYEDLREKYGPENGPYIFEDWFRNYTSVDVVDTGLNRCHDPEYVDMARRNAALIRARGQYVPGSNVLQEKLLRGEWDEDFRVYAPGEKIAAVDFLPPDALYFQYNPSARL